MNIYNNHLFSRNADKFDVPASVIKGYAVFLWRVMHSAVLFAKLHISVILVSLPDYFGHSMLVPAIQNPGLFVEKNYIIVIPLFTFDFPYNEIENVYR